MKKKKQKKTSKKMVKKVKFRVKQALINRGGIKNHKPTVAQAQSWFNVLNQGIFYSRLTLPTIEIKRLKDCFGECECSWDARSVKTRRKDQLPVDSLDHPSVSFKITLKSKYDTWKDFIETLAHEMVHLHQMTIDKDPYSNHSAKFFRWRSRFKTFGLALTL